MALNLTDSWQMAKILTDNWHLYPPIQTLFKARVVEIWREPHRNMTIVNKIQFAFRQHCDVTFIELIFFNLKKETWRQKSILASWINGLVKMISQFIVGSRCSDATLSFLRLFLCVQARTNLRCYLCILSAALLVHAVC